MKILALDLGQKRIGLALAEDNLVGSLSVIEEENRSAVIQKILEIVRSQNIEKIILGIPQDEDLRGEDISRSFALELNKIIKIPIEFVDETLTSKEAERLMAGSKLDPRSKKYKEEIDKISAKIILEQYLKEND